MTLIIFVRHGESECNIKHILSNYTDKYPLTKKGIKQAKNTGRALKNIKITKVLTSPILRTRQTSEIISKYIKIKPKIEKNLTEREFGNFLGRHNNNDKWKFTAGNNVESFSSIQNRILSILFKQKNLSSDVVLCITHHDPIVSMLSYSLSLDEFSSYAFRPNYASISIFDLKNKKLKLIISGVLFLNKSMLKKIPKKYLVRT